MNMVGLTVVLLVVTFVDAAMVLLGRLWLHIDCGHTSYIAFDCSLVQGMVEVFVVG